ncbi:MAG TPA: hypothetical protein VG206_11585 [Terriglobia bacterium]|nr:hypothetical protein [Terriglobia bacterium]
MNSAAPPWTGNNIVTFHPVGAEFSGPGNALLVTAAPASVNDTLCTDGQHPNLISASGECLVASSQQRASFGFTGRA